MRRQSATAGLADPARADQRQKAALRVAQEMVEFRHFALPAEGVCCLSGTEQTNFEVPP